MKIKVIVTKRHIKKGNQCDETSCPIALAIQQLMGIDDAYVYRSRAEIHGYDLNLPRIARRFIALFDDEGAKAVRPFSFFLTMSDSKKKMIYVNRKPIRPDRQH